jgi:hypothetical protein
MKDELQPWTFVVAVVLVLITTEPVSAKRRALVVWCAEDCQALADALNHSLVGGEHSQVLSSGGSAVTAAYLSVLPLANNETELRMNPYARYRPGGRIHGFAEFAFGKWAKWRQEQNRTWSEIG